MQNKQNQTTTTETTKEKGGFFNVLARRLQGSGTDTKAYEERRKIICKNPMISKGEKEGVIRLYDALVTGDKTRTINVDLIMEEGLPAFKETLGEEAFKKLKKYFGIGCRPSKFGKNQEIGLLLEQIRTVENAQYYIDGYKELLEKAAAKLHDAPEEMTMLERAKLVRMYHTIFVGYYFFAQDFRANYSFQKKSYYMDVDFQSALRNNSMPCRPEDFFITKKILIDSFPDDSLIYDLVCMELFNLDEEIQKEILQFAELRINDEGELVSVNIAPKYQTYYNLRMIKQKIFPEMGIYPMELFAYKNKILEIPFEEIYQLYKILKIVPIEKFEVEIRKEPFLEGSKEILKDRYYYKVSKNFYLSGQAEIDRIIRMMEYLSAIEFELETTDGKKCNVGKYITVLDFLYGMEYIDFNVDINREFELVELLMERDTSEAIIEFKNCLINAEQLKKRLGIDATFEKEQFGIEKLPSPKETIVSLAIKNGYAAESSTISDLLIENVILPGNEEHIKSFTKGEIDESELKARIGFEESFAEMYFDLSKVDMTAIENKLQDLKRSLASKEVMKRWSLLIDLYCFIVENGIPCGPKGKIPKRNKSLKPANLKAQIS